LANCFSLDRRQGLKPATRPALESAAFGAGSGAASESSASIPTSSPPAARRRLCPPSREQTDEVGIFGSRHTQDGGAHLDEALVETRADALPEILGCRHHSPHRGLSSLSGLVTSTFIHSKADTQPLAL
jgi:hypothetical protein